MQICDSCFQVVVCLFFISVAKKGDVSCHSRLFCHKALLGRFQLDNYHIITEVGE